MSACAPAAHLKGASVADVAHAKGEHRVLKVSSETKSKSIAGECVRRAVKFEKQLVTGLGERHTGAAPLRCAVHFPCDVALVCVVNMTLQVPSRTCRERGSARACWPAVRCQSTKR